tara:strand:+ start:35325 stop:35657 length:333 start_codon:yes stop_codon:yes gene_type:complete
LLNKKYKLLNADEYSSVFNFRKRLHTDHLYIHFAPNQLDHYRIGFVISKKMEKMAVRRNYIKRTINEIVKISLKKSFSADIVFRLKKSYYKADFKTVKLDITNSLRKIVL